MKKVIIFGLIAIVFVAVLIWFGKMNAKSTEVFETEKAFKTSITKKTVATGKVVPLEQIAIKPQITGIIDKIYLLEGTKVQKGDLLATVRVVPNEQSLLSAKGRVDNAKIALQNAEIQYKRNKGLYDKGVVAAQDFEQIELNFNQSKQELVNAENDYQIIKSGSSGEGGFANTDIRAQISGTILEIPVKEGDQVIQSNNFNDGTTIATIADMNKMIFEGKVDEAEVGRIKNGIDLDITLGAIQEKKFPAKLNFIAPKGTEENGAVQFTVKADVTLDSNYFLRAGYSANAEIVLDRKDDVMAIEEALLQYDKRTDEPFVEVKTGEGTYERKTVKLGISDGINVEILEGITMDDEIKVWNKKAKKSENDSEDDEEES